MARKKQSPLEDLIDIAAHLPWKAGLVLALIAYLGFHYAASLPVVPVATADLKSYSQSIGHSVGRQLLITISSIFQYVVPLTFLIGSAVSFIRSRRQQELHHAVANNPTQDTLEEMSWRDFENLAVETFRQQGYRVVERGGSGPDGGVDIELHMGKDKYLVQCKQWKVAKVGVATVRELYGVMTAERAVGGFVVASGQFTEEARSFAEGRSINLLPAHSLLQMIQHNTGHAINSQPVEDASPACPKCGSPMVQRVAQKGSQAGNRFWGCTRFPACRGVRS